jgi:hypothetical protein
VTLLEPSRRRHSHLNLIFIFASPRARNDILNFIGDPERR